MAVSYVICAAGLGSRTLAISKTKAKPFLQLQGRSLLQRSIESLPLRRQDQLIVLYSTAMLGEELNELLSPYRGQCQIHTQLVSQLTRGQLETALLGLNKVPQENSVCIFNSDTAFVCQDLLAAMESGAWDGLIPCSQQQGDAWSFCEVSDSQDEIPRVLQTAEKLRISEWCSVGLYWFNSKKLFQEFALQELNEMGVNEEVYVAPMYNRLIAAGYRIGMCKVESFKPMGSVEQIEKYWGVSLSQMRRDNEN